MRFFQHVPLVLLASAALLLAAPVAAPLIHAPVTQWHACRPQADQEATCTCPESLIRGTAERALAIPLGESKRPVSARSVVRVHPGASSTRVSAFAEDDKKADPGPVVPDGPTPPKPPTPPPPDPSVPLPLDASQIYVITSQTPIGIRTAPDGLVKITLDQGPMRIKGKIICGESAPKAGDALDGSVVVSRAFQAPYIYTIEAAGTGLCYLTIPRDLVDTSKDIKRTINVGGAPIPPGPGPDPNPTPDPFMEKPGAIAGPLKVLIVYDANAVKNLTPAQYAVLYSEKAGGVKDYIRGHVSVTGGYFDFRIWADGTDASADAAMWGKVMAKPRKSLPWLYAGNGKNGYNGPLPANTADTLAVLKKLGGE